MVLRYMQYCLQKILHVDLIESAANEGMFKFSVEISGIQVFPHRILILLFL